MTGDQARAASDMVRIEQSVRAVVELQRKDSSNHWPNTTYMRPPLSRAGIAAARAAGYRAAEDGSWVSW